MPLKLQEQLPKPESDGRSLFLKGGILLVDLAPDGFDGFVVHNNNMGSEANFRQAGAFVIQRRVSLP